MGAAERRNRKRDSAARLGRMEQAALDMSARAVARGLDWVIDSWPGRLILVLGFVAVAGLLIGGLEHSL